MGECGESSTGQRPTLCLTARGLGHRTVHTIALWINDILLFFYQVYCTTQQLQLFWFIPHYSTRHAQIQPPFTVLYGVALLILIRRLMPTYFKC